VPTGLKEEILACFADKWLAFYERYGACDFRKKGNQHFCSCPLHKETEASFAVTEAGKWYCHAEKIGGDAFSFYALKHGLKLETEFSEILKRIASDFSIGNGELGDGDTSHASKRPVEAIYNYEDAEGRVVALVFRFSDGKKPKFLQGRPRDGERIKWGLAGLKMPLYHLPEVLKASEVIVVEGEKDADNTRKLGFTATTCAMGAGKWRPDYAEHLRGKHIVLCGDNDEPGRKHMQEVGTSLLGVAASVKLLELPGLPPKGDVSDWIARFKNPEEAAERLALMIEGASPFEVAKAQDGLKGLRAITPAETSLRGYIGKPPPDRRYLFADMLPEKIIAGLIAPGGTSKGFLLGAWAVGLASGQTVLKHFEPVRPVKVLILLAEDSEEELHRRIHHIARITLPEMTGEVERILFENLHGKSVMGKVGPLMDFRNGNPARTEHLAWLKRSIEAHQGLEVLMLDPKSRFYGLDENSNDHNTAWVACLEEVVRDYGLTVLFSHHVSKASSGTLAQTSARGGSALVDACRWVANLRTMDEAAAKTYEIENPKMFVEFDVTKSNYAPALPRTLYFRRGEEGVLVPVNLEFLRLKEMAEELCSLVLDAYQTDASTFTKRELRDQRQGGTIREALKNSFAKCTRQDISNVIDYCLKEGRLVQEAYGGSTRPRDVLAVPGMLDKKPTLMV
jgi:hypothetical protein